MTETRLRWTPGDENNCAARPLTGMHALNRSELFTEDVLEKLLDAFPRRDLKVYTAAPAGARYPSRRGRAGRLSGADLMSAVRSGQLWLRLEGVDECIEEFADMAASIKSEIEAQTAGVKARRGRMSIVIASPNVRTDVSAATDMATVWQIRGRGAVELFPTGAPCAADADVESLILGVSDTLRFEPGNDEHAEPVEMTPGRVATWPQTAPYRIVNGDDLGVMVEYRFSTASSYIHANALYANGVLRRTFGLSPDISRHGPWAKRWKAALGLTIKAFSSGKSLVRNDPPWFKVDPSASNAVRDLAAA